jgi:hypothetical protein
MNSLISIWAKRSGGSALLAVWGLAAALVIYVLIRGGYLMSVVQIAAIYTIFVTGLNIFMGYAGQVSVSPACSSAPWSSAIRPFACAATISPWRHLRSA